MTLKKIITVPNPFLRKKAVPIEGVTNEIKKLLDDMLETMYNANGIGLAATQIEDERRLIVIDCGKKSDSSIKKENEEFNLEHEITLFHMEPFNIKKLLNQNN